MLQKLKAYFIENGPYIAAGLASMSGGYYRPYDR